MKRKCGSVNSLGSQGRFLEEIPRTKTGPTPWNEKVGIRLIPGPCPIKVEIGGRSAGGGHSIVLANDWQENWAIMGKKTRQ